MTLPDLDIQADNEARRNRIRANRRAAEQRFLDELCREWADERAADPAMNKDMDQREKRWVVA